VVLLGLATALFFLLRLSGDPVLLLLPPDAAPGEAERLRRALGLDEPVYVQYLRFIGGLARLDFGDSLVFRQPALGIALERLPATLELTAAAVTFSVLLGFPLGILSAVGRRAVTRAVPALVAVAGQSMPAYWLGVLLILLFSVRWRLFPSSGDEGLGALVLPTVTLGLQLTARVVRLARSGIRREMAADYVRTAHGKGLRAADVVGRHVLPNMVIPVIAVLAVDIGHLMGGAVITESIFAWPGVGRQLISAVLARDYPVVEAIVFVVAIFVIAINLAADLLYRMIDPRLRHR
jgi:ABC-type dipeptide/oligopeptide/nickel transport system permease component